MATKDERIAQAKDLIKVGTEALKELGVLDGDGTVDLAAKHRQQDSDETLFSRSTPAERLHLYETDRDAWQRMMDAHEAAGLRKLFGH